MAWWKRKETTAVAGERVSGGGRRGSIMDHWELEKLFEECCENGAPVVILSSEQRDAAYQGRFSLVQSQRLTLDLLLDRDQQRLGKPIGKGALVSIAFTYENRSHVFLAEVLAYLPVQRQPANLPKVVVGFPRLIAASEARMTFRVPVTPHGSGLAVNVHTDAAVRRATPLDLSLTGMLLTFPDDDPQLAADQRVGVELIRGDKRLRLAAVVVPRHQQGVYGVYFPEVLRGAHVAPPALLRDILGDLERDWLLQKVKE